MKHNKTRILFLLVAFAAIAALLPVNPASAGTASLKLVDASASLTQTSDTGWTLEKTGSVDQANSTVTWDVTATEGATIEGLLVLNGTFTVTNTGSGDATIGNIVVNLQERINNTWVTVSSNVADATDGDAATTANIHAAASSENESTFTENSASGSLNFMDATNNTLFSLVPQVLIGAGETRTLLFSSEFNNNDAAHMLTPGTKVRAEIIVSFGNATQSGNSTADVDINGNGQLDADEARVRSVPSRLTVTVPAPVNGNGTVTLSDTLADIVTTGTASISNISINLGATSGTVTGTVAGSVTNCAHLTSSGQTVNSGGFTFPIVDGVDLQACSTVNVAGTPPSCTPGAPGCGWDPSDMETASQTAWGDSTSSAGATLISTFNSLYPTDLVVGGTNALRFTDASAVFVYLPAAGSAGVLTSTIVNPITTSAGEFGGQVTALRLNVDHSSQFGNAVSLASLTICGLATLPTMNGQTVGQFLTTANQILGGGSASISASQATALARFINTAFVSGSPSDFAQTSLVAGNCTAN